MMMYNIENNKVSTSTQVYVYKYNVVTLDVII